MPRYVKNKSEYDRVSFEFAKIKAAAKRAGESRKQPTSVALDPQLIAELKAEAQARGARATIAVTDRVGNVLAVYRMGDAATRSVTVTTSSAPNSPVITGGLEGISLPSPAAAVNIDQLAAIAKAVNSA